MSLVNTIGSTFVPIHREGWRFVAIAAVVTLVLYWVDLDFLASVALVLTCWCAYFFRDLDRVTPLKAGLLIVPADGRISSSGRIEYTLQLVMVGQAVYCL